MKKFNVTVYRRTFTTYEVEVEDDFNPTYAAFELLLFESGASDWLELEHEEADCEVDSVDSIEEVE